MNTLDVIFSGRPIRHYLQETIEWDDIQSILDYANTLPKLLDNIAVEFKLVSNIEEKQGFRGPFTIKAPYYLCISSEEKEDYLLNAGYMMQAMNLYLVSRGFGTRFVGSNPGFSLKSAMKYKYVVALAFGKTDEKLTQDNSEEKCLPESDVVIYKEEVPSDIRTLLTAARLAPSALNSQPWRFVVYKNHIHIFTRKNPMLIRPFDLVKIIDMGIMLSNLLSAADELWVDAAFTKSDSLKTKSLKSNEYIGTIVIA